jgi:hypothetical protein
MSGYKGSPWRSRFIRGPKIGLELAAREDFVELGKPEIAEVSLGLKSGYDSYFFLTETGREAPTGRVSVQGLGGWTGAIPRRDLRPAIQTPKDLDSPKGRLASIPMNKRKHYTGNFWYFCPRFGRLDPVVREYVNYGEARSVHEGTLVQANADDRGWYHQTRNLVCSRWALPYNSGYDYGAVNNAVKAVLNGRFVGVEPTAEIQPELLGGILNSTFVTLMRLLEGVATGNEGAFDVGPPAARVMRIPDPRKMSPEGQGAVAEAMEAILSDKFLPHAPIANGAVPMLRRELDLAVFTALGIKKGYATAYLDHVYESYARWRGAVEALEDEMQLHRRALARRGGSRTQNPSVRAATLVWDEMSPATPLLLNEITGGPFEMVDAQFPKPEGSSTQQTLFDLAFVLDRDNKPLDLHDQRRLSLGRYIRSLGFAGAFPLPLSAERCGRLLEEAKATDASFVQEATRRAKAHVSEDLVDQVVAMARRVWISKSITALREATIRPTAESEPAPEPSLFDTEGIVPPTAL